MTEYKPGDFVHVQKDMKGMLCKIISVTSVSELSALSIHANADVCMVHNGMSIYAVPSTEMEPYNGNVYLVTRTKDNKFAQIYFGCNNLMKEIAKAFSTPNFYTLLNLGAYYTIEDKIDTSSFTVVSFDKYDNIISKCRFEQIA